MVHIKKKNLKKEVSEEIGQKQIEWIAQYN